jgi:hypothetical protein
VEHLAAAIRRRSTDETDEAKNSRSLGLRWLAIIAAFRQPDLALSSGTRIGAYEIVTRLGSGGMGEV